MKKTARTIIGAVLAVPVLLGGLAWPSNAAGGLIERPAGPVAQALVLQVSGNYTAADRARIIKAIDAARARNAFLGPSTGKINYNSATGSATKDYMGGSIVWSAAGAFALRPAIRVAYLRTGGKKSLNFPTSAEMHGLKDGGSVQHFTDGDIYWSPKTGAHKVINLAGYEQLGVVNGRLGYPWTDQQGSFWGNVPLFRGHIARQWFQGGMIQVTTRGSTAIYPVTSAVPAITGTAVAGSTLTAVPGEWGPAPVTLTYQWYRSHKPISGATGATYTVQTSDRDRTITVEVTGSKAGYTDVYSTSTGTKVAG